MESYLNDKNKISKEWQALCGYVSDYNQTSVAELPHNMDKNRYKDILPCNFNSYFCLQQIHFFHF
jgi:hypothetical protein